MKTKFAALVFMVILTLTLVMGCGGNGGDRPAVGDTVRVNYTGTLSDGSVFDSSEGGEPLEFVMGAGSVVPGFEKAVSKMKVGEKKTVKIPPEEAYGPRDPDLVAVISKDEVPEGMEIRIGQKLPLKSNRGDTMTATVVEITEDSYILDGNQQLAGEELTFEIELISIERASVSAGGQGN
jgi:peptidylprolyl isomerase